VVLHLGEHDGVTFVEVGASPRVGDEVDGFGDVLRPDESACRRGSDERGHLGPRFFVTLGRLRRDLVHAAMHVRVVGVVDLLHRVEHGLRLLRRCRGVEIHQPLAVRRLVQQREVLLQPRHVERCAHEFTRQAS
jgi:hypothetical protein